MLPCVTWQKQITWLRCFCAGANSPPRNTMLSVRSLRQSLFDLSDMYHVAHMLCTSAGANCTPRICAAWFRLLASQLVFELCAAYQTVSRCSHAPPYLCCSSRPWGRRSSAACAQTCPTRQTATPPRLMLRVPPWPPAAKTARGHVLSR